MRRVGVWNLLRLFLNRIAGALPVVLSLFLTACANSKGDSTAGAPHPVTVESENFSVIQVPHPEQFALATAVEHVFMSQLTAIGTVGPDLSNTDPRILSATVCLLLTSQRVSKPMAERRPCAPLQQVDLSRVWIVCGLPEDDLVGVHAGETVEIRLNASSERVFSGRVNQVSASVDPKTGTAKVGIQARNPGFLSAGMYVTVTFPCRKKETRVTVPATAILHFHHRDWVYVPAEDKKFHRVDVVAGQILPGNVQEIVLGIEPGEQVVQDALVLQKAVER